ncbi:DNA helicase RecQ [Enterovirga sp.]|uniref:DNA helicase RecQ n=1 Tax=Enterovirga sp. TaxID=2026350 RepID=UPI002C9F1DD3|nr:DNA helicase RecQ [Enterovirga sp.]HMO28194.1 DNA helicase RecQ [Enterovirga sp.]
MSAPHATDPSPVALGEARRALKDVFGYDDFRPGQEEIVAAALAGEDVFAVMPTGSGKSMCFQLPAVVDGGLTVVVSPLIALMRDQVRQLVGLGVRAASLNSADSEEERRGTWAALDSREVSLLFVSPERLATGGLPERLRRLGIVRLVVDEAHCVSQWGHDFRPEYRQIPRIREALGEVQVLAFTATADAATRADILRELFSRPPRQVVHSFDRPNLSLRFEPKERPAARIEAFARERRGQSGIVYTASRAGAERLAALLDRAGLPALAYHAGLDAETRARRQDRFLQEDGLVMAATVAFGMGINKPDLRYVVHADMPGGIESYYQEIGRAGRDGLPADTLTLYGLDDMMMRRRQIAEKEIGPERRRIEERRLAAMIDLCEVAVCRRQSLLAYFGETSGPCGHCDLCRAAEAPVDATVDAQKALSAVVRTGQRFGAAHLASLLVGEDTEAIRRHGHDRLKTFGVGRERDRRAWQATIRQLFAAGALAEASEDYGGFALTPKGEDILFGRERIALRPLPARVTTPRSRRGGEERVQRLAGLDEDQTRLFEKLRTVRSGFAKEEGVPAFMVFPDRTLAEMATLRPRSRSELRAVQGVGDRKLLRYGDAFLAAITEAE